MNLVSIQGKMAPGYHLEDDHLAVADQLMRGLAGNNYLIISSKYRTDFLYESQHEKNETIIRLWCLFKHKTFDEKLMPLFFRTIGPTECLVHFLTRLIELKRMSSWYDIYRSELQHVISNKNNHLSAVIRDCLAILTQSKWLTPPTANQTTKEPTQPDIKAIVAQALAKHNEN